MSEDDVKAGQRALEIAAQALGRLEAHERACEKNQAELKASIGRVHSRLDKLLWAVLSVLALIAWTLLQDKLGL